MLICNPCLIIIGPSVARDDNDNIKAANESYARKTNIITIITHCQVYVLLKFAESREISNARTLQITES